MDSVSRKLVRSFKKVGFELFDLLDRYDRMKQVNIFKEKCGSFFCKTTATMQATNIEGWMDGDAQGDAILKIRCKAMLSAILTSTRDGDFSKWTFTM